MAATIVKSEGDRYAALLKRERVRHGRVENEFLRVIKYLQHQVAELNAQLAETQLAYVTQIATSAIRREQ